MSGMRRAVSALAVTVAVVLPVSACGTISAVARKAAAQGEPAPMQKTGGTPLGSHLIGYSTPNFPSGLAAFQQLEKEIGVPARIATWYTPMTLAFHPQTVAQISDQGVVPIVEIDSGSTPLTQVADGKWDKHFIAYARAVAAYSTPIGIDFDHEFNGPWFHWGYDHTTAATFVAAWRRIVWLFRKNGARNVMWIWNPNVDLGDTVSFRPWYPGNQYVTYVGLDGYFIYPDQTFNMVFGRTLSQLSAFTHKSILLTETGANPGQQRATQINSLFAGLEATPRILGFIWFDFNKYAGHDWLLQGDKPALEAFHADARMYQKGG
jgi:mannan endo-1,4-beta-mannosidase